MGRGFWRSLLQAPAARGGSQRGFPRAWQSSDSLCWSTLRLQRLLALSDGNFPCCPLCPCPSSWPQAPRGCAGSILWLQPLPTLPLAAAGSSQILLHLPFSQLNTLSTLGLASCVPCSSSPPARGPPLGSRQCVCVCLGLGSPNWTLFPHTVSPRPSQGEQCLPSPCWLPSANTAGVRGRLCCRVTLLPPAPLVPRLSYLPWVPTTAVTVPECPAPLCWELPPKGSYPHPLLGAASHGALQPQAVSSQAAFRPRHHHSNSHSSLNSSVMLFCAAALPWPLCRAKLRLRHGHPGSAWPRWPSQGLTHGSAATPAALPPP